MVVMQKETEKNNSVLFTIITLGAFVLSFFLITFLKQRESKEDIQSLTFKKPQKSRVKISNKIESKLNERQKVILEEMKRKREMTPKEIYSLIPNVSTRTVRRDMDVLVELTLVKQQGSTKATTYIYSPFK
jgi:predicted HTH transcriptional regulator